MPPPLPDGRSAEAQKNVLAILRAVQNGHDLNKDPAADRKMGDVWFYLKEQDTPHWYCSKASDTIRESAIFLQRLHAYLSDAVLVWKSMLVEKLHGCFECTQAYEASKRRSREVYFTTVPDHTLDHFFATVNNWEQEAIIKALKDAMISPEDIQNLDEIPRGALFHILANPALCVDNDTFTPMLLRHSGGPVDSLAKQIVPSGLLVLAVNKDDKLREWAQKQLALSDTDIPLPDFKAHYSLILETLVDYSGHMGSERLSSPFLSIIQGNTLWGPLACAMEPFPVKLLREGLSNQKMVNAFRRAIKRLEEAEQYETAVFQFIGFCLRVYAFEIWANTPSNYPDIVFKTITKEDRLQRLVRADVTADQDSDKSLSWVRFFLLAVWIRPQSRDVLQAMFAYLVRLASNQQLPELVRALAMKTFGDGLLALVNAPSKGNQTHNIQLTVLRDTVLQHKSKIIETAFQGAFPVLRDAARSLLESIFLRDLEALDQLRFNLNEARLLKRKKASIVENLKEPVIHVPLWTEAIQKVNVSDRSSVQFITRIMARSAHIDVIGLKSLGFATESEHKDIILKLRMFLKSALLDIRSGFDDLMARFGLVCEPTQLGVQMMSDVITLLFSPVTKLHNATLELFGDCDGRKACIRLALSCQPQATLHGVLAFVEAFNGTAGKLIEACSAAKSLVRCFVDVIENLCGPEQNADLDAKAELDELDEGGSATVGLLSDPSFGEGVRPMLRTLWKHMCRALALIFAKCPNWADYFDPKEMIEWMRDALIFGRLMRAHAAAFQDHAHSQTTAANSLETMQGVQNELVAWFRLTDPELIYQAYELMMSFLQGGIVPSPTYRAKLERRLKNDEEKYLPVPKIEAMQVTLDQFGPLEVEETTNTKQNIKAEKRRLPADAEDSKLPARPTKAARRDDQDVLIISDDEPPAPRSSRAPSVAKLEQTSINKFLQSGATSKPSTSSKPQANKPAKASATSKIYVSTIKPAAAKSSVKSKTSGGSGLLAKARAGAAAWQQQMAAQRADVQMRNLAKNSAVPALNSSSPPPSRQTSSRPPSSASSANGMESDSSSSSDEEDIKKTTLASLAPTVVTKKPEQPKRTMVMLDGPPVLTAQQRRLQEMKRQHDEKQRRTARLKPNLEGLHEQILRWSIDHDGPQPLSIGGNNPKLTRVVPKFSSKNQYFDIFHPLLINECWSQMLQAKEEGPKDPIMCLIMTRSYVDNFTDIAFNIVEAMPERWYLAETDIVLLRSMEGDRSILAKITGFKRGSVANQIATGTMRLSTAVEQSVKVQVQERWKLSKIYSLSTINREYAALTTAQYYDLIDQVLSATSASVSVPSEQRIKDAMRAHRLNEPQAKAILASLGTTGFSLIQGPPGTGKTSTICGLAGSFVSFARDALLAPGDKEKKEKRRLLVCAPSNAAIDEVTKRLADGVRDNNGQPLSLKVVRVGTESSMNVSVTANSLDSLVDEKMAAVPKTSSTSTADITALRQELADVKQKIDAKRNELDQTQPGQRRIALENEFRALKTQRTTITSKLDTARDQQKNANRVLDAARRKFRHEVLSEADVICSTLSGAGHEVLEPFEFETVVIDEAAQAIEIATLIPLRYGCKTCILVGDPQQLPPTVISQLASGLDYNQSLFVRLQRQNPNSVHLLSIQYRMHPTISSVPSRLFYNGRLQDGPDMDQRTKQVWHTSPLFGPYQFFDVIDGREEAQSNHSQINRSEADAAVALYDRLKREFQATRFDYRIGVVSMYRGQVLHIKSRFQAVYGPGVLKLVDFNTVDGFQGQEKDIIILSCVRAGTNVQTVGFLADERRMNVALTRSRSSLFILGHAATLERCNQTWKTIVEDARTRGYLVKYSPNLLQSTPMHKPLAAARTVSKNVKVKPSPSTSKGESKATSGHSARPPLIIERPSASTSATTPISPSPTKALISPTEPPEPGPPESPTIPTVPVSSGPKLSVPSASNPPLPPKQPKPTRMGPSASGLVPAPASAGLPPKPQPPRPPPPRKKAAVSAFIPKDKQKKTQLGGP